MNKIAIIGANSFLAKRLRTYFSLRANVVLNLYGKNIQDVSSNETCFDFYLPDERINYENLLSCDVIVYCAGAGIQATTANDEVILNEVNVLEPIRICTYLQEAAYKGKVITFGSYFEIGNNTESKKYSEEELLVSQFPVANAYAQSKRILSRHMNIASYSFKNYHLILGSIYGKGENENRIIPYVIHQLQTGQSIRMSSGEQIRQYIHVNDVVVLLEQLIVETIPAGIYNVSSADSISIKELTEYICKQLNNSQTIQFGSIAKADQQMAVLMLSIDKIQNCISWKPSTTLEQGISEYVHL